MLGPIYLPIQQPTPHQVVQSYANGVTIKALKQVYNPRNHTIEWSGGVTVTYGPTTVTADRLVYHDDPEDPYGEALGNVKLTDPEGTITAADLIYHWEKHTGSGHNIVVQVSKLKLEAESIDIQPDLWTLRNVGGTGCQLKTPLYYIRTRELQIRPDQGVRAIKPQLSILGHKLLTLPNYSFSFQEEGASIGVPYPTYRSDRGFGIDWTNAMSISPETTLFTKYTIFQRSLPFYNATLMQSLIHGREPEPVHTEIGDRFSFGYFDNVQVRTHQAEELYLKKKRLDVGIGSTFGADGRDTTTPTDKVNKPFELMGHASGNLGGFGIFGLARAQQVRIGNGPTKNRLILEENILSPALPLGNGLYVAGRLDAAQYSGGNGYGWERGQAGVFYDKGGSVRLGVSYSAVKEHGLPDFAYDTPFRSRELSFRTDFDFDTTQIRFLLKYDPSTGAAFDREIYLSQVVGCIEPFLVYRERPRKFFIGIKLPISRTFDKVRKDLDQRAKEIHTISGTR